MKKFKLNTVLLFLSFCLISASNLLAYKWTNYTNFSECNDLAKHNDTLWVATTGGIIKMSVNGTILKTYTATDGLQNSEITCV